VISLDSNFIFQYPVPTLLSIYLVFKKKRKEERNRNEIIHLAVTTTKAPSSCLFICERDAISEIKWEKLTEHH